MKSFRRYDFNKEFPASKDSLTLLRAVCGRSYICHTSVMSYIVRKKRPDQYSTSGSNCFLSQQVVSIPYRSANDSPVTGFTTLPMHY